MPAGIQDLLIEQGSTWTAGLIYKVNGAPQDITGYTVNCQIKQKASGEVIATPICTIVDSLAGAVNLELTDEQTWLIPANGKTYKDKTEYTYDVTLTSPTGVTFRLLNGIILISPGVTKP